MFPEHTHEPAIRLEVGRTLPMVQGIRLVPASDLPDRFRSLFPFPLFNAVQSKSFRVAFTSDDNLVLSAPTGSGKTVVMELAICRLMASHGNEQFKVIYQAPTKSLCSERFRDWQAKFGALDLECAELTGDTDYRQLRSVQNARIIVTTPEKWDSVTRKWKDHAKLMQLVKLFLIDEVHVLKDARGATLEAVVSRMKSVGSQVRFIALSATVPNSEDIATWLGKNAMTQHLPAHREVFGEEYKPVQLQKFVYGYRVEQNDFVFDSVLTKKYDIFYLFPHKLTYRQATRSHCKTFEQEAHHDLLLHTKISNQDVQKSGRAMGCHECHGPSMAKAKKSRPCHGAGVET
jgi:ATP-dependent DNA helicase HFM1/MER3